MKKLNVLYDYIEAVVIDEASQCVEIESLIPLKYSPNRVILIGDPK